MTPTTAPSNRRSGLHISSQETEEKFQDKVKEIQFKEKERMTEARAAELGLGYINLRGFPIEPETLTLIDHETSNDLQVVSFFSSGREIRVGAVDPESPRVHELCEQLHHENDANVQLYLISNYSFDWGAKLYESLPRLKRRVAGVEISSEELERYRTELKTLQDLHARIRHVATTDVLTMILAGALQTSASDIHLEAEENDVKLRYRIDGVLQTIAVLPKDTWPKIVNRVKLLAGLKINIDKVPQDGRVTIYTARENIDVRVSTLPSSYGESIVMRLLMSATSGLKFEEIGLRDRTFDVLAEEIKRPNGMIITTGPTSSGKTTTLYAILNKLNTPERKIITLEDPIEYRLPGISQSQVEHGDGANISKELKALFRTGGAGMAAPTSNYTFAMGLKAVLRQNPDIIMVGEMRDAETAEIAIHAALTGHLVLSTLHTNNAAGAIPRFLAMGIKPFLIPPSINAVIAQRLVRRVCDDCKEEVQLTPTVLERIRTTLNAMPDEAKKKVDLTHLRFFQGKGCHACHGLGLRGRIGIFEVFTMTPEIEQIILSGKVSEHVMEQIAIKNGMILMVQDGLLKALDGLTTVEEVFRVTQ